MPTTEDHDDDREAPESVQEADDRYSRVDADDVVEDAGELFGQHAEGPPPAAPQDDPP